MTLGVKKKKWVFVFRFNNWEINHLFATKSQHFWGNKDKSMGWDQNYNEYEKIKPKTLFLKIGKYFHEFDKIEGTKVQYFFF